MIQAGGEGIISIFPKAFTMQELVLSLNIDLIMAGYHKEITRR